MTNYSTGHEAEKYAVEHLKDLGYKVRDLNWKTRYCEIDIVAEKNRTIFLVEVKFRKSSDYGTGLEYITKHKLKQMSFAAELWRSMNNWEGDYQLAVIEMTGSDYKITNFLTDL